MRFFILDMSSKEKLRLDKYLWSIRLFKTRTAAAAACDTGKVKFEGVQAKAAKNVNIGEEYEVKRKPKDGALKLAACCITGLLIVKPSTII